MSSSIISPGSLFAIGARCNTDSNKSENARGRRNLCQKWDEIPSSSLRLISPVKHGQTRTKLSNKFRSLLPNLLISTRAIEEQAAKERNSSLQINRKLIERKRHLLVASIANSAVSSNTEEEMFQLNGAQASRRCTLQSTLWNIRREFRRTTTKPISIPCDKLRGLNSSASVQSALAIDREATVASATRHGG